MTENDKDRFPVLMGGSLAALAVVSALLIHCLPREIAVIAVSWMILSISAGVSFGHFVLNEP